MENKCQNCGTNLPEGAKFCNNCGATINIPPQGQAYQQPYQQQYQQPYQQPYQQQYQQPYQQQPYGAPYYRENVVQRLSQKVKTESIIWYIVAGLQLFTAVVFFFMIAPYAYSIADFFSPISIGIVGVVNLVLASKNLGYSREVLEYPINIVDKYQPIGGIIGNLIYNILFGGLIGIIGSIYHIAGVRSYVMSHHAEFRMIEENYYASQKSRY